MTGINKVFFNIFIQMLRSVLSIIISLYTSRIILQALGVEDFGIYCLLSGIVLSFNFIHSSISTSIKRYIAFYLGEKNIEKCREYLFASHVLYTIGGGILCLAILIICEFFFNIIFNISAEKVYSAKILIVIIILSFYFGIFQSPRYSILVSHECFTTISVIHILDVVLKLLGALLLFYIQNENKLLLYGFMIMCISALNMILYFITTSKFEECHKFTRNHLSKDIFKDIICFSAYVVFSLLGRLGRLQGISLVINHYFGVVLNASWGVAQQVGNATRTISTPVHTAFEPLIIKTEGKKDRDSVISLSLFSGKMGFLTYSIFFIPLMLNMQWILDCWLKNPPESSALLCIMFMTGILFEQVSFGLSSAIVAIGNIKFVFIIVGILRLLTIPFLCLSINLHFELYSFSIIYCAFELICTLAFLFSFIHQTQASIGEVLVSLFVKSSATFFITLASCYFITLVLHGFLAFLCTTIAASSIIALVGYTLGLNSWERGQIKQIICSCLERFQKLLPNVKDK